MATTTTSALANTVVIPPRKYDYLFKYLLVGDSGVGKTSTLSRFADSKFSDTFVSTVGVDFRVKSIIVNEKVVKLQVWDTAGQERFRSLTYAYFRGSRGVILMFDVTDERSFSHVATWMQSIDQHAPDNIPRVLVGNKIDREDNRVVSRQQAESVCRSTWFSLIPAHIPAAGPVVQHAIH